MRRFAGASVLMGITVMLGMATSVAAQDTSRAPVDSVTPRDTTPRDTLPQSGLPQSAIPQSALPQSAIPGFAIPVRDSLADSSAVQQGTARVVRPVSAVQEGPPLSPRRAFLTSLLLPGYAQAKLDRPTASILFVTMEILAIGMARKSAQDLREARNAPKDSVFLGYAIDPATGDPVSLGWRQSRYTEDRIKARRTHYEDWITAILFNHIISSADAFVSAHLWDFKPNVEYNPVNNQARIGARKTF